MEMKKQWLKLYLVTDRSWLSEGETLEEAVEQAILGGVTMVQLREKGISRQEYIQRAVRMKEICHRYQVPLIINDDIEVALRSGADGVHVGQQDASCTLARKLLGPDKIIGVSAHNKEEAKKAAEQGASYLGCGAVFGSSTKKNTTPLSYKELKEICTKSPLPAVAIGGITKENALSLAGSGAAGIAVISAVLGQKDYEKAAREMKQLSRRI